MVDTGEGPQPDRSARSVKSRVLGGAAVSFTSMMVVRVLGIANLAILGRLLTPADFGLVALAMVVIGFIEAVLNNQFEIGLIRRQAADASEFDTAFTMALCAGLAMAASVAVLAWPIAWFFDQPELAHVLWVLTLVPLLQGLRNTYFVRHRMELRLIPRAVVQVTSRLSLTVVAVTAAVIWGSHWALVAGTLTMYVVFGVLTYLWSDGMPRLGMPHWREYLAFGGWLSGSGAVGFLNKRFATLVVGQQAGPFETGIFHMGREVATTFTSQLTNPMAQILFPGLAAIQDDRPRLRRAYLQVQQTMLGLSLPLGLCVALVAPELVRVGLGLQWLEAVPIIQILAPATAFISMNVGIQSIVFIDGNTRRLFIRDCVILSTTIIGTIVGYSLLGTQGAALGTVMTILVGLTINMTLAASIIKGRIVDPLLVSWRSLLGAGAMVAGVLASGLGTRVAIADTGLLEASWTLLAKGGLAAATYFTVVFGLWILVGRPDGFESTGIGLVAKGVRKLKARPG